MALQQGISMDDLSDSDGSNLEIEKPKKKNKNKKNQIFRPEKSFCRPIMMMYDGTARVVNKYFEGHSFVAKRLATGSILGESDTLKCVGIDYFGDIYAEKNGLMCLVIEKPDIALDEFEILILKETLGIQHHDLQNMLETRFPILMEHKIKNY